MSEVKNFEEFKKRKKLIQDKEQLKYDGYLGIDVFTDSKGLLSLNVSSSYPILEDEDFQMFLTAVIARLREINTKPPK